MEKKKLLLVAISVGVFLVLTIGAAILVFTPRNSNLPFETITTGNPNPETIAIVPPPSYEPTIAIIEQQPSSIDAVDLVRNPGGVPGLVTPAESAISQASEAGRGTGSVISVTQPTTAAVPSAPPTGRAANQPAPSTSTPTATARPAQTTTTPTQTTTTPAQTTPNPSPAASAQPTTVPAQTASRPTQTNTTPSQTASRPAQTTTTPAQTASTQTTTAPAQIASRPTQPASTPAQTASTPAQTMPTQIIPTSTTVNPTTQAKIHDDYWVQTGAFSTVARAEGVKETLASKGITSIVENGNVNGRTLFRVRVGPYTSQNEANYWLALIKAMDGFEDSQVRQSDNLR